MNAGHALQLGGKEVNEYTIQQCGGLVHISTGAYTENMRRLQLALCGGGGVYIAHAHTHSHCGTSPISEQHCSTSCMGSASI